MRRYWGEVITSAIFVLMALYVIWDAWDLPSGGGVFPIFAAICTVLLSLYWMGSAILKATPESREEITFDFSFSNLKPMFMLVLTIGYVLSIFVLGYFVATTLYLVAACLFLGVRNWLAVVVTGIILIPAMYGFFVMFLGTNLPEGFFI